MRSFERYLYRRTIGDPETYFRAKGITTNERLEEWCENHGIEKPEVPVFSSETSETSEPEPEPVVKKPTLAKKVAKKPVSSPETENWHVPAAERPLKKPTAKRRSAPKKKVTK